MMFWESFANIPALVAIWLTLSFVTSYFITRASRKFALTKRILAVPNERSAHTDVKPKGGGISFVIILTLSVTILLFIDSVNSHLYLALIGGGLSVAIAGLIDDWITLSAIPRLIIHFGSAVWAVWWLGGFSRINVGIATIDPGMAGIPLAVIFIVWSVNLYNFMDGIDSIASVEALMVLVPAGSLLLFSGDRTLALICFILAIAVAGFLPWNWPSAKIFMGDIGSGYLGYCIAVLIIASENRESLSSLIWFILMAVFFTDATATLIRRIVSGEKWWKAHRTHAYQLLLDGGLDHQQVVLRVIAVNCILGALAFIVFYFPLLVLPALTAVFLILFIIWYTISFGKRSTSQAGK